MLIKAPQPQVTPTELMTDEQVVARVLAGDAALFEIIVRRHNTRVYRTVRALLRNETDVEDAMQAAYLLAFAKLKTFRGGALFSAWLTQIAVNEALGRLRRDRRHPAVSLTLVEESTMLSAAPPQTPEAHASRRELAALLERAVDALPELYRVVFVLREIEGMNTADAAAALDVSEEVIKTRLSRARALLRDTLERLVGAVTTEAFEFHASRCDRIVAAVLEKIAALGEPRD
ncbi:MAG TPA: RNA polymerase sigma factor [Polyangiaceae bacterium]